MTAARSSARRLGLLAATVLLAACGGEAAVPGGGAAGTSPPEAAAGRTPAAPGGDAAVPAPSPRPSPSPSPDSEDGSDPAAVAANELGQVPVIMYHRVLPDGGGDYDLTPEEFRAELARLYAEGYRPIRTVDLVRGEIDVPAGTTPVVLTFDDGSREQFALDDAGQVAADTAIGMLLEFAEEHADFAPVASVYVNVEPFGGGTRSAPALADLHERGFELGNHTYGHVHLGRATPDEVRKELALGAAAITATVPGAEVVTLSLPFGAAPESRELLAAGSFEGDDYAHEGVLLVGAGPARSPFHAEFDPLAIPRIRTSPSWAGGEPDYGSAFWLDVLADHPERRYVSDGDPATVSFPAALAGDLDERFADRANPY